MHAMMHGTVMLSNYVIYGSKFLWIYTHDLLCDQSIGGIVTDVNRKLLVKVVSFSLKTYSKICIFPGLGAFPSSCRDYTV